MFKLLLVVMLVVLVVVAVLPSMGDKQDMTKFYVDGELQCVVIYSKDGVPVKATYYNGSNMKCK